ncbi:MAG: ribosome maturation factor RimP [Clostridia bacterium]|nr:ribosome maturation factor RimP [Clostridia bacterium]
MADKKSNASGGIAGIVAPLAEPITAELGLMLWDVRFIKEGATWILRVIIDREDQPVSINDCVDVSRRLSPVLDEADPIAQSYCLEVTSPGADRELVRPEHFAYYEGYPVKVTFYRPDDSGQREITGILLGFEDNTLRLLNEAEESLAFDKKQIAVVHAVDQWEEDDETL